MRGIKQTEEGWQQVHSGQRPCGRGCPRCSQNGKQAPGSSVATPGVTPGISSRATTKAAPQHVRGSAELGDSRLSCQLSEKPVEAKAIVRVNAMV